MNTNPIAKINLGLNVVERRPDGYHNLETIFFPVPINDELSVNTIADSKTDDLSVNTIADTPENPAQGAAEPWTLKVISDTPIDCPPEKNLVIKALMMVKEKYQLPPVEVVLNKMMPSQAGMGGGSSDGAYMIRLLNDTFSLGMSIEEMQGMAARLGADCAFFINPVPSYATGIGEKLEVLQEGIPQLEGKWLALVKPNVAVSTKEAYAGIHPHYPQKNCLEVIKQPIEMWREYLVNDFEESIFKTLPVLAEVKQQLYANGALYAAMSGSGSTIFGIFENKPEFITTQYASIYNRIIKISQK